MPIWDFYCKSCQTTKEVWVLNRDAAEGLTCETCGTTLERKPAAGAFVVTGYNYKNGYSGRK